MKTLLQNVQTALLLKRNPPLSPLFQRGRIKNALYTNSEGSPRFLPPFINGRPGGIFSQFTFRRGKSFNPVFVPVPLFEKEE
jgi:hypothetical protein